MRRVPRCAVLLFALAFSSSSPLSPSSAHASWIPNGSPVCTNPANQASCVIAPDESGGAFIAWLDGRNSPVLLNPWSEETDVYLQRMTSAGVPAPGWPVNGVPVCTASGYQGTVGEMAITPDGEGGVILMWVDNRDNPGSGDLYAQRMTGAGTVAAGWPLNGMPVCTAPDWQDEAQLAPDGAGGAFAIWRDQRKGDASDHDTYAQHLTAAGTIAPGWPPNGLALDASPLTSEDCALLEDGAGGAFFAITRDSAGAHFLDQLIVTRFDGAGQLVAGWPAGGVVLRRGVGYAVHPSLVPDGSGGVVAAWADTRTDDSGDLYVARVSGAGVLDPAWPANGTGFAIAPAYQGPPVMAGDGLGGALLAWSDNRNNHYEIFAQHVTGGGTIAPGWPASGRPACATPAAQNVGGIASDGLGGAYVVFLAGPPSGGGIFAQHLTSSGANAPGWPAEGTNLRALPTGLMTDPRVAAVPGGGAIVAWADDRGPAPAPPFYYSNPLDIYAAMVGGDGPVPVLASLVSADLHGLSATLVWQLSGVTGGTGVIATVERRRDGGAWSAAGEARADGTERFTFVDAALAPGHTYDFRLGYTVEGKLSYAPVAEVVVPAMTLAISHVVLAQPSGAIEFSVTLASDEPARLELFDVGGRRVASSDLGSLGAGVHAVRIEHGAAESGLLLARLRQGRSSASVRAIVLH